MNLDVDIEILNIGKGMSFICPPTRNGAIMIPADR